MFIFHWFDLFQSFGSQSPKEACRGFPIFDCDRIRSYRKEVGWSYKNARKQKRENRKEIDWNLIVWTLMPVTNNSLIGVRPWAIGLAVQSINPKQFCNGAPVWATALSYLCSASGSIDCKTVRIFAYSSTREQSNKRSGILMSFYATLYQFLRWFWGKNRLFRSLCWIAFARCLKTWN